MLNAVFGVKHPAHLTRRDSSSKTRQNDKFLSSEVFGAKNPNNLDIPGLWDASGDLSMTGFS